MEKLLPPVLLIVGAILLVLGWLDRRDGQLVAGAILLAAVYVAHSLSRRAV